MTFPNIEARSNELGLDEITVLKHYSENMPNKKPDWICWHQIKKTEWEQYLDEFSKYTSKSIIIHSGVETELVNEKGDINIPLSEQEKIDMCALSVHYMINLDNLPMDFMLYPDLNFCPSFNNDEGKRQKEEWRAKALSFGADKALEGLVNGYINAVKRYPKIKTMAHMYDGIHPLRTYLFEPDMLTKQKQVEILEPLMKTAKEYGVLWELIGNSVVNEDVLIRANEIGVKFCATADGHMLYDGWGPMTHHNKAEEIIDRLKLNRGIIEF